MSNPIRPDHYTPGPYEAIKVMKAWMTPAQLVGFLLGNCLKYLSRLGKKDSALQDAKKARQYLDWLIEALEEEEKLKAAQQVAERVQDQRSAFALIGGHPGCDYPPTAAEPPSPLPEGQ